ncbi:aromatic acid exporter family protein [Halalkalibacter sp. APA_J-10(15)]|uniref:FUSC family protein n=1 Tax=unclassified Halalkalibacter TaxID=2893063 RepID=UPI001FF2556E|nr:aromatic acid exporter family protein [Halalkalibacter sp. APA_J-10(15)]MCK0472214.1 aromatic acid exporter family protein [Halalkalibacter sp. APA_J-10(15)]
MNVFQKQKIVGERIIKTAVAVFITATVCHFLHLPYVFAVIIAIVTIEPTAAASIKKGAVRFPAALIGAALSMTFTFLFGQTPITYTLAAFFTIYVCHKLKLDDGALIATITAVAMIPISHDQYFLSFVERAGTTTIGLFVSTLVNLTILPAHFLKDISKRNKELLQRLAILLEHQINDLIEQRKYHNSNRKGAYRELTASLSRNELLCQYQKDEWKYHRHSIKEQRYYIIERSKLEHIQQIHYYIGHLLTIPYGSFRTNEADLIELKAVMKLIIERLNFPSERVKDSYLNHIHYIEQAFWESEEASSSVKTREENHPFSNEKMILFVLLSIDDELKEITKLENKKKQMKGMK